jgi:uncharacterized protein (TIGR03790 family)
LSHSLAQIGKFACTFALVAALFIVWGAAAVAELRPDEIAIIASRTSRESQALAQYYCEQRGVPEANICLVDVPRDELVSNETWTWAIRPEIQKWITENDPDQKLRCLVTLWDVPLRIGPADPSPASKRYQTFLADERSTRLKLLKRTSAELRALATGDAADLSEVAFAPGESLTSIQSELEAALQAAQQGILARPAAERGPANSRLQQLATAVGGARVLLQGIDQQLRTNAAAAPPELRQQFDVLRGRAGALVEVKSLLDQQPAGQDRDALMLATIERVSGLIGSIEWLNEQIDIARKNETGSSFDSELSLVMWPDGYQLLRWQPNYLRPGYDNSQLRQFNRTLMVARLDGPSPAIARRLIDDAIAVEKAGGLSGKVYIDARGIAARESAGGTPPAPPGSPALPGSYEDYERSLLDTARGIDELTDLEVVLNDSPELFAEGECPETALYLGWYSLAKYVDAFEFNQGAIAVHYASGEAATLRKPESEVWCKRLLEEGVCATIGPVYEPYLIAFPRPDEFAAQLLDGKLSLVEVYYRTKPFNSWMMTLVGDPLYRPFRPRDIEVGDK